MEDHFRRFCLCAEQPRLFVLHVPVMVGGHRGLCSAPSGASLIPSLVVNNPPVISLTTPWHVLFPTSGDPELVFSICVCPGVVWGELVYSVSTGPSLPLLADGLPDLPGVSMHWMLSALYLLEM